jgi:hypothetical protein
VQSVLNINRHPPAATVRPAVRSTGTSTRGLEMGLLVACLALLALGAWGPSITQPSHYHAFADQRALFGVPNMMDVLSNLAFVGFGLGGIWRILRWPHRVLSPVQQSLTTLFFFGLVVTALFSGWYHLQPDNEGLVIDRCGMAIAFAGLLGLAAATRVSDRAGQWLTLAVLVCGACSIWILSTSSNVLPWAVLQYGGIALMLGLGFLASRESALPVPWITVIVVYALAKFLEQTDAQVYHLTGEMVSGHTLKHIVASFAALPVLRAMSRTSHPLESSARSAAISAKHQGLDSPLTTKGAFP